MDVAPPDGRATFLIAFAVHVCLVTGAAYCLVNYPFYPLYVLLLSSLVLLVFAVLLAVTIHDHGGLGRAVSNGLGMLSSRHFVEARERDGGPTVCFGFTLLVARFTLLEIPCTSILTVEWVPGQATVRTGRDRADWHVVLWFRPSTPRRWGASGILGREVHVVTPGGAKSETAQFGQTFVEFLRSVGVDLRATEAEGVFVDAATQSSEAGSSTP